MKLKLNFVAVIAITIFLANSLSTNVSAVEVVIDNNGDGSENSVVVSSNQSTTIDQSNFWNIFNRIFNRSSTGNNTGNGGSINTGNSTTSIHVTTTGNSNYASDPCCGEAPQVPEFGFITGAIAALASGGAFLLLKRRVAKS